MPALVKPWSDIGSWRQGAPPTFPRSTEAELPNATVSGGRRLAAINLAPPHIIYSKVYLLLLAVFKFYSVDTPNGVGINASHPKNLGALFIQPNT